MPKHIYLSFPLSLSDPRPPAIPAPELSPLYTVEKDGASVHILKIASHTGTHVDAPRHVIKDGLAITDFTPAEFIFTKPVVIDLHATDDEVIQPKQLEPFERKLKKGDLVLFRFGYGRIRHKEPKRFSLHSPGFGVTAARWLRSNCSHLRAIGMDVPSLACIAHLNATMAAHKELLAGKGRRFLVIEDMDLDHRLGGLCEVRLCPWLVTGMDSSPCTVIGGLRS